MSPAIGGVPFSREKNDAILRPISKPASELVESSGSNKNNKDRPRFKPVWMTHKQVCAEPAPTPLIDGLIHCGETVLVWGAYGSAKSFAMIDMAETLVGTRETWFKREVHHVQRVAYACLEGGAGMLGRRLRAYELERAESKDAMAKIRWTHGPVDLGDDDCVDLFIESMLDLDQKPQVVFVDTMSKATPGMNENATDAMTEFVSRVEQIRDEFNATVVIVHHCGKDESRGSRGSYALAAGIDVEVEIKKVGRDRSPYRKLVVHKVRDGEVPPPMPFRLQPVHLPIDKLGHKLTDDEVLVHGVTSCVLAGTEGDGSGTSVDLVPDGQNAPSLRELIGNHLESMVAGQQDTVDMMMRDSGWPKLYTRRAWNKALKPDIDRGYIARKGNRMELVELLEAGERKFARG